MEIQDIFNLIMKEEYQSDTITIDKIIAVTPSETTNSLYTIVLGSDKRVYTIAFSDHLADNHDQDFYDNVVLSAECDIDHEQSDIDFDKSIEVPLINYINEHHNNWQNWHVELSEAEDLYYGVENTIDKEKYNNFYKIDENGDVKGFFAKQSDKYLTSLVGQKSADRAACQLPFIIYKAKVSYDNQILQITYNDGSVATYTNGYRPEDNIYGESAEFVFALSKALDKTTIEGNPIVKDILLPKINPSFELTSQSELISNFAENNDLDDEDTFIHPINLYDFKAFCDAYDEYDELVEDHDVLEILGQYYLLEKTK